MNANTERLEPLAEQLKVIESELKVAVWILSGTPMLQIEERLADGWEDQNNV